MIEIMERIYQIEAWTGKVPEHMLVSKDDVRKIADWILRQQFTVLPKERREELGLMFFTGLLPHGKFQRICGVKLVQASE